MDNPTIVLGASPNNERYSYKAVSLLKSLNFKVYAVGKKNGEINGIEIMKDFEKIPKNNIHTISIYLNEQNQKMWYNQIIELKPRRVIFNPGAENPELEELLNKAGIETLEACTLVLLRTGQY